MNGGVAFRKIASTKPVVEHISEVITSYLSQRKKVLWLIPGGSAIKVAVEISRKLAGDDLKTLTVSLTDERYGPVGHPNSNWHQLTQAGFRLSQATLKPVLRGRSLQTTANDWADFIKQSLIGSDYSLGFFGIGTDGHIAGIKPGSLAVTSQRLAVGYSWDDYQRITITSKAIAKLNEAVAYMVGKDKHPVIRQLVDEHLSIEQQPAQVIKQLKRVTVYNDYLGEPN